jgi:hypothetical protein
VRFPVLPGLIARVVGEKLSVGAVTVTVPLPGVKPGAEAVTVADPIPAPVTCGCVAGVVAPPAINTLAVTVTLVASLLARVTVTPPTGADCDRLTAKAADCPSATVVLDGTMISTLVRFTVAVAVLMPVALAVIVADPAATHVTATGALVAAAAKLTLAATVATLVLLELRLTIKPPAGACPPVRLRVRLPVPPAMHANGDPVKLSVGAVTVTVPLPDM